MSIANDLARTQPILSSAPTPHTERRNVIRQATDTLSRRGIAAAKAELSMAAIERVLMLAFEQDESGYCNLDPVTGRLLFGLPWGRKGCHVWGLRPSEARVLSAILTARPNWLFAYDADSRGWQLRLRAAPSLGRAMSLLQSQPIGAVEWRETSARLTTSWARSSGKVSAG